MFERFTDRARRVVVLSQEVSRLHCDDHIGPLHLLAGLIKEEDGIAAKVLKNFGVTYDDVFAELGHVDEHAMSPPGHIPFTPYAKKILELSLREALQLGHNYIGTEHVLLGIMAVADNEAGEFLNRYGEEKDIRHNIYTYCQVDIEEKEKVKAVAVNDKPAGVKKYRATLKQTTYKTFEIEATSVGMAHAAAYGAAAGVGNIEPVEIEVSEWQSCGFGEIT